MHSCASRLASNHILHLPGNTKGIDYIVADLHGSLACLESILDGVSFKSEDRLFIAGDFIDRGPDSFALIKLIKRYKNIYPVLGNHEFMVLRTIRTLESILDRLEVAHFSVTYETIDDVVNGMLVDPSIHGVDDSATQLRMQKQIKSFYRHIGKNGGQWLLDYFIDQINQYSLSKSESITDIFAEIKGYMQNLPYIITVAGCKNAVPFHVVHADMPISDEVLLYRAAERLRLSSEERHHALWARENHYPNYIVRDKSSILTYCGHEIITKKIVKCVRKNTNTINLDVASCSYGISLVVNHTEGKSFYFGPNLKNVSSLSTHSELYNNLLEIKSVIDSYLDDKTYKHVLRYVGADIGKKSSSFDGAHIMLRLQEIYSFIRNRIMIHQGSDQSFTEMLICTFIDRQIENLSRKKIIFSDIRSALDCLMHYSRLAVDLRVRYLAKYRKDDVNVFFESLVQLFVQNNPELSDSIQREAEQMMDFVSASSAHTLYDSHVGFVPNVPALMEDRQYISSYLGLFSHARDLYSSASINDRDWSTRVVDHDMVGCELSKLITSKKSIYYKKQ